MDYKQSPPSPSYYKSCHSLFYPSAAIIYAEADFAEVWVQWRHGSSHSAFDLCLGSEVIFNCEFASPRNLTTFSISTRNWFRYPTHNQHICVKVHAVIMKHVEIRLRKLEEYLANPSETSYSSGLSSSSNGRWAGFWPKFSISPVQRHFHDVHVCFSIRCLRCNDSEFYESP